MEITLLLCSFYRLIYESGRETTNSQISHCWRHYFASLTFLSSLTNNICGHFRTFSSIIHSINKLFLFVFLTRLFIYSIINAITIAICYLQLQQPTTNNQCRKYPAPLHSNFIAQKKKINKNLLKHQLQIKTNNKQNNKLLPYYRMTVNVAKHAAKR